jgi:GGDEF domain-containing protein
LLEKTYKNQELKELEHKIIKEMNESYEFNGVSFGLAHYPENGKNVDELINYADSAMYGEKKRKKVRR